MLYVSVSNFSVASINKAWDDRNFILFWIDDVIIYAGAMIYMLFLLIKTGQKLIFWFELWSLWVNFNLSKTIIASWQWFLIHIFLSLRQNLIWLSYLLTNIDESDSSIVIKIWVSFQLWDLSPVNISSNLHLNVLFRNIKYAPLMILSVIEDKLKFRLLTFLIR